MVALALERRLSKPEGLVGFVPLPFNVTRCPAALLSKRDHRDKMVDCLFSLSIL